VPISTLDRSLPLLARPRGHALGLGDAALDTAASSFGLGRPYLGVSYPSDGLAGALLGTLIGGAGA